MLEYLYKTSFIKVVTFFKISVPDPGSYCFTYFSVKRFGA